MPWVAAGLIGSSVIGGVMQNQAAKKAAEASKRTPLDIPKLIEQARVQDEARLADSLRLEKQYAPENAALRGTVNQALQVQAEQAGKPRDYQAEFLAGLQDTISRAPVGAVGQSVLDELKLGSALPADVQAQTVKGSLEGATAGGFAGSAAGRGLTGRDLGLTSLAILRDRQNRALGVEDTARKMAAQGYLDTLSLGRQAVGQDRANLLGLASLVEARGLPEAGLSGADIANLAASENNAANQNAVNMAALRYQGKSNMISSILGGVQGGLTLAGAGAFSGGGAKLPYLTGSGPFGVGS